MSLTSANRASRKPPAAVPRGLVTASEWAWRTLVIAALVLGLWFLLQYFSGVAVPLAIAVLFTALLTPINRRLRTWGLRPVVSAILSLLLMAAVIGGVLTAIGAQVAREMPELVDQSVAGLQSLLEWLANGPLHISQADIDGYIAQLTAWVNESRAELAGLVADAGVGVGHFLAGAAVALIASFFFLAAGKGIWSSCLTIVPDRYRPKVAVASGNGWTSLVAYMRAQVVVAFVDALGMLVGALILQIPMAWALFALTFIVSFIPVVGAVISGTIAVLLALVTHGWVTALIMLGITILVVQTEGHFLQPILLGRAVQLHPLAVLVGLAIGATLAGIVGALLVIPVLAFGVAFIRGLDPGRFAPPAPLRH
ncbi:MAG: AI-2E family transporter [Propionicimonas sp.]|nr:AI-2E family transporter [Propionicimonas sp.]